MSFVNYYEELGIERTVSLEEVKQSIKANRKRYRQLTGSPNIDQRSMAERKMNIIADAEKVFENEETRNEYDAQLAQEARKATPEPTPKFYNNESNDGEVDYFRFAREAYYQGNRTLAISYAEEALKFSRTNADLWSFKGRLCLEAGDYNAAELAASEAYRLNPSNPDSLELRGDIYREKGDIKGAVSSYQQAYEQSKNIYYIVLKAKVLFENKLYREVITELTRLMNNHPSEVEERGAIVYELLGKSYYNEKAYKDSLAIAKKLLNVSPFFSDHVFYIYSLCKVNPIEAEKELEVLKNKHSKESDFYEEYGALLIDVYFAKLKTAKDTSTEEFFGKTLERNRIKEETVLDNKEKVEITKAFLQKVKSEELEHKYISSQTRSLLTVIEERYKYASKRHSSGGCLALILLFVLNWIVSAFIGKIVRYFYLSNMISLAILSYLIVYLFYPKGYQLNRRNKGK